MDIERIRYRPRRAGRRMTAESLFTRTLRELARYNSRANARLYDRCAELPDEVLREATDAALGSVLALLEHVLAADRIWLSRLQGRRLDTMGLSEPTFRELAPLRRERDAMDDAIEDFVDEADEAVLAGTLRSVDSRGEVHMDPVHRLMMHMFNHQTHHRGQVHTVLRQWRQEPLALDLHRLLRDDPPTPEEPSPNDVQH